MTFTIFRLSTFNTEGIKTFTTIKELKDYFNGEKIIICWDSNEILIDDEED